MPGQELKFQEKKSAHPAGESTKNEIFFSPHVDIYETEREVVVMADMPGVTVEGIELGLEDNILTIQGQRNLARPNGRVLLEEYESGHYLRRFNVAETIDQEHIEASLSEGVLTVRLPKILPAQPKKIEVRLG